VQQADPVNPARKEADLSIGIALRRVFELFFNVRNLFDVAGVTNKESDVLPDYIRRNGSSIVGAVFNLGVKGTF